MNKPKVAVLVFSDKRTIRVGRDGRSDYSFDGIKKRGIEKIISEIHGGVGYCSKINIDDYDHVLVSLTSYHDVINLINNVPINRKAKVHIGGPACNNINPLLQFIDTANFGRCDCGKINRILDGDYMDSVWRKSQDPLFEGEYVVDASSVNGLGEDEVSFGCKRKCAFCFYSHWNGHVSKRDGETYDSGFNEYEDFFQTLNWEKAIRGAVTALDGTTEHTRAMVRKPISAEQIEKTLLKSNSINTKTRLRAKVYSIVGYPWEGPLEIENLDLINAIKTVERELRNNITIRMHFSHFIPFQKTPMWNLPFNFNNYRDWCVGHKMLHDSGKVRVFSGGVFTPSPANVAISTVIQRARQDDSALIKSIASATFLSWATDRQLRFLRDKAPHLFCSQDSETIANVSTPNKMIGMDIGGGHQFTQDRHS